MLFATVLLAAASLVQPRAADPGDDPPRTLAAVTVDADDMHVDGRLDEAAWATATAATDFVQQRPAPGQPATEATEARVLYSAGAVYIGMRMHDRDMAHLDTRLARRDSDLSTDWAIVAIDSYGEGRTGFVFQISAGGVQRDILLYNDTDDDDSWDAVWDAAVSRDADGWTAEFRIPLSQLRFAATDAPGGGAWGLQFGRTIQRLNETAFWAPMLPTDTGGVSLFGRLTGLVGLRPPRSLEIVPYVAGGVTRAPGDAADPFYAPTDAEPRVGLDLKYGLTGDLTLTATVNPDFGQVEADPATVNLGGFELFFQERRPFFVEGADIFSFGTTRTYNRDNRPDFLYTRRIGRAPQRTDFVPSVAHDAAGDGGAVYTSAPLQSPILGAAKLSGRIGRVSIGALSAVTGRQIGSYRAFDAAGSPVAEGTTAVEPLTHYGVVRARTTVGRTTLGAAGTAVHRERGDDVLASLLPRQALVGELDAEHRLSADWILSGVAAMSHVSGTTDAITRLQNAFPRLYDRPDAGYLALDTTRTSLAGYSAEVSLQKAGGRHWLGSLSGAVTSPGFDSNGLGFQSRADVGGFTGIMIYQHNDPVGQWLNYSGNVFAGTGWNFAGDRTYTYVGGNLNGRLRSFWGGGLNASMRPRAVDDRLTRGGPVAAAPAGFNVNLNGSTDDRKTVAGYAWTGMNRNEIGSWYQGVEAGVDLRPSSSVQISIGPGLEWSHTARQYLDRRDAPALDATFGQRYVFGGLDQTGASMTVRADWTFTPTLSLQLVARPFIAAGRYVSFGELAAPGDLELLQYGRDGGSATRADDGTVTIAPPDGSAPFTLRPDFTVRALQGNAVLRWEYRPGSALFVVWQQSRQGYDGAGDLRWGRDVRGIFTDAPTNVFLVKLSYWLG